MENLAGTRTNPYIGVRVQTTDDATGVLGTHLTEGSVDPARRRLDFYRLAAEAAVEDVPYGWAVDRLRWERGGSPPSDPSRAWTDDDLEEIVRRTYVTHRQRRDAAGDAGGGKDGRTPGDRDGVDGDQPRAGLGVLSFSQSSAHPAVGVDTPGPAEDGPEDLWPERASA